MIPRNYGIIPLFESYTFLIIYFLLVLYVVLYAVIMFMGVAITVGG